MADQQPTLMSAAEAGERLGVSSKTIRRAIAAHQLRAVRIRKQWRIPREDVERMATPEAFPTAAPVQAATSAPALMQMKHGTTEIGEGVRIFKRRPWETADQDDERQEAAGRGRAPTTKKTASVRS